MENNEQMLTLNLSVKAINAILGALARQPYEQVFELVHDIQTQSRTQLRNGVEPPTPNKE